MNVVALDRRPSACPACGLLGRVAGEPERHAQRLRSCLRDCVRTDAGAFADASTICSEAGEPHVHVACAHCGFEWLCAVADPAEFRRLA